MRISNAYTLFDSSHRYADNGLWSTKVLTGGTAVFNANQGLVDLSVTSTSGSSVVRETSKVMAYQPGKSLLLMNTFVMADSKVGLRQRIGYFGTANGMYLQLNDNALSLVKRTSVGGSIVDLPEIQSSWNGDKLDGTGPSGLILDITKAQILWMDIEWLGVGSVRMGFVINGRFIVAHTFHHANILASTYITTASLPLRYEIENTANTAGASTLKQICSTAISEGGYEMRGAQSSIGHAVASPYTLTTNGVDYPILTLRFKNTRADAIVILSALSILPTVNGHYRWKLMSGSVTSGGGNWLDAGANSSVEYKTAATTIVTAGRIVASGYVNATNQSASSINLLKEALFQFQLERDSLNSTYYEMTLAVSTDASSAGKVLASVDWEEISR
jgi:hypothetical protein